MKPLLRMLLAFTAGLGLLAAVPGRAQTFPNSNLETWESRNGREVPANWLTIDDLLGGIIPTGTVTKTTVAHGGSFAAQLQTQTVGGLTQFPGAIILGTALRSNTGIPGGLPFTARPASLQFYYQLSGQQALADSASMVVLLSRRVNGTTNIIAGADFVFPAQTASYTLATVPLQYLSGLTPDSVSMIFFSGTSNVVTAGTILRIDDISFSGTATATRDAALAAAISIFPNPSPDGRFVLSATDPALLASPLTVLDATGRLVRHEVAPTHPVATRALDLSELPAGLYTVQLYTPRGLVMRKLSR